MGLSERNVIELITKLRELGFLGDELLHTSNGREFVTRDRLRDEVAGAVDSAGGRLPLVDLPALLGADLAHCERAAQELIHSSPAGSVTNISGELLTPKYFTTMAQEADLTLQENGVVALGDLARRFGLGLEVVQQELGHRLGLVVFGRLEGSVLYTESHLARIKAQLRGALRGALSPVSMTALRRQLGLENLGALSALLPTLTEELQREGAVSGKLAPGGSWIPALYAKSQRQSVRSFYEQNGFVAFDYASKHGVTNAAQFLASTYPEGLALQTMFISPTILHQANAAIEDALASDGWCDVPATVPGDLTVGDVATLLSNDDYVSLPSDVKVFAETCVVSNAVIQKLRVALCEDVKQAAQKTHRNSSKARSKGTTELEGGVSSLKGGKVSAASKQAGSDDEGEDWTMGTGKKGAKSKGGKKGKSTKPSSNVASKPQQPKNAGSRGDSSDGNSTGALTIESLARKICSLYPELEGAGTDGDLPHALATELRPDAVTEYERALSDIFTAGTERRRRLRDAASTRLDMVYRSLQLHAKGADLFKDDEANYGVLQRHLMRIMAPTCVDAVLHSLAADTVSGEEEEGVMPMPPEQVVLNSFEGNARAAAAREAPKEVKAAVDALVNCKEVAEFQPVLEAAAAALGLRPKILDKKSEYEGVEAHIQALSSQLESPLDAPTLLSTAVPLLVARHRRRCVSLPGRALGAAIELLREDVGEEGYAILTEFQTAVVEHLKGGGAEEGAEGRLAALEYRLKEVLLKREKE